MDRNSLPVIWVVDDSVGEAELARRALAERHAVRTFTDGANMLEVLERGTAPDVLVVDWEMPGMSGIEICQFLRSRPQSHSLAILMLTGYGRTEDLAEGLAAGANDFIAKPFRALELSARVAALIRSNQLLERAERAEAASATLLWELPEALLSFDAAGKVVYANAEAGTMLGADPRALSGRAASELVPGVDLTALPKNHPEGTVLPDVKVGDLYFAPVLRTWTQRAEMPGTTLSFRNVTSARQLQARRLDFYSVIAHDLRSPLQAIGLRTELMLKDARLALTDKARQGIEQIRARTHDLTAMVSDFLEFASLETAEVKLASQDVEVGALVSGTVSDFEALADAQGVSLQVDLGPQPLHVRGDRRRLVQVVTNLIANAIKFTARGGEVTVRLAAREGCVETRVRDTGRGIPQEAIGSLFNRYTRVKPGEGQPHVPGTGLGLLIVREIIEAHGGSVGVQSKEGQGSTFWFRLPAASRVE